MGWTMTDIAKAVSTAVDSLGYELVDFESTARGLLRVYIDSPNGITVEDCANVSNHLTRVFAVEEIDFDRLEVSSPGLDRPVKKKADFVRFAGCMVKVRLSQMVDSRKRFDGRIERVEGDSVVFCIIDQNTALEVGKSKAAVGKAKTSKGLKVAVQQKGGTPDASKGKQIVVPLDAIDRVRLKPDV